MNKNLNSDPTQFFTKFPMLSPILATEFPEADFEGVSDKDIVINIGSSSSKEYVGALLAEGNLMLNSIESFWEIIGSEANRNFESPNQARQWLFQILEWLDEGSKKAS